MGGEAGEAIAGTLLGMCCLQDKATGALTHSLISAGCWISGHLSGKRKKAEEKRKETSVHFDPGEERRRRGEEAGRKTNRKEQVGRD